MDPSSSPKLSLSWLTTRQLIILTLLMVLLVFGAIWWQSKNSEKTVTLYTTRGITVSFGTPGSSEDGPRIQKVFVKTSLGTSLRVKKGPYAAEFVQTGRHTEYKYVYVDTDTLITPPKMPYIQAELTVLLKKEAPGINVFLQQNPATSNYTPGYEQIYGVGDWFAATLLPHNQADAEQRIILHKQNGKWEVSAGPAATFYIGNYPAIPQNVIRDINNH